MFHEYGRAIVWVLVALSLITGGGLILFHEETHNPPDLDKFYWLGPNLEQTLSVNGPTITLSEAQYQQKVKTARETWVKIDELGSTLTNIRLWLIGDAVYIYSFPVQAPNHYYFKEFKIQDGLFQMRYKHKRFYLAVEALWLIGFSLMIVSGVLVFWKLEEKKFVKNFIKDQEEKNKIPDEFFDELLERTSKL